jgi:hypothetical protein
MKAGRDFRFSSPCGAVFNLLTEGELGWRPLDFFLFYNFLSIPKRKDRRETVFRGGHSNVSLVNLTCHQRRSRPSLANCWGHCDVPNSPQTTASSGSRFKNFVISSIPGRNIPGECPTVVTNAVLTMITKLASK